MEKGIDELSSGDVTEGSVIPPKVYGIISW